MRNKSVLSSSSLAWQPLMGHSLPWISWQQNFYRVGAVNPTPNRNLEDQASGDWVTQLYPQALGTHLSRLLRHAWATLGLFLYSGHHTEKVSSLRSLKFSPYLKENTLHHYKDQLVNAV
jgi:hypothetical protein